MTIHHSRCTELGVCQGLGPDQCPDCDCFECEAEVPARTLPGAHGAPRIAYPFAPGAIEGPDAPMVFQDDDGPWYPLSLAELGKMLALMAALGLLAGYLVERLA